MLFLKYLFLSSNVRFEIFKYTVILEEEKKINKISPRYVKYSQYDEGKGEKKKKNKLQPRESGKKQRTGYTFMVHEIILSRNLCMKFVWNRVIGNI